MNGEVNNDRLEIDLYDVLKQRVDAGKPIYISGPSRPAVEATIDALAKHAGKTVRVVRAVDVSGKSE